MKLIIVIILIIILVALFMCWGGMGHFAEPFAEISGQLCYRCEGKTFNQCINCFNCLATVDQWGTYACLSGDEYNGLYNKEKVALIYSADPYTQMKWNNKHYLSAYGMTPKASNRRVGVYPCGWT
jgi:hypothetical protein